MFSFNYAGKIYTEGDFQTGKLKTDKQLSVSVEKVEYSEFDAYESLLWFENTGDSDSAVLSDINDCDMVFPFEIDKTKRKPWGYIPDKNDLCVISMNGMVEAERYWENAAECATEFTFNYDYLCKLPDGKKSFENRGGRSSDRFMPFFDITVKDAGYMIAIGWTGDWKAEFTECDEGVRVKTGLKETNFYLKPGEKIRTSSVLVMRYTDKEDKYNKFRKLIKAYYSHTSCTKAEKEGIMAFEFFGSTTSEVMKQRINEMSKRGIAFDEIWIDAGWYGKCQPNSLEDWDANVGEWNMHTETHPEGLKDVSEVAKEAGMKLMLWLEPERARKGMEIVNAHPDWYLSLPEDTNCILNYGNEEAWSYVYNLISNYIKELDLGCYRQDFNVELTEFFKQNDEPDRRGITEIKHIMGMYDLWDKLLQKYHGLLIDNCASGGRRFDIETLKRSIAFFRSDYFCNYTADPEVIQVENNVSKYLPYGGACNKVMDKYCLRSSYASSFGYMGWSREYMKMSEDDFVTLKSVCDEYIRIRKYFSKDFYNHGAEVYDTSSWTIWQYNDEATQSGIVMAFRRIESPFDNVTIELKGLKDNQMYNYFNFDTKESFVDGNKINIKLTEKKSSVIIEYSLKEKE